MDKDLPGLENYCKPCWSTESLTLGSERSHLEELWHEVVSIGMNTTAPIRIVLRLRRRDLQAGRGGDTGGAIRTL